MLHEDVNDKVYGEITNVAVPKGARERHAQIKVIQKRSDK